MLPVIAAFNEIISSDTECEEEISTQEYDDSINYSLYSDDECIYDAEEHDFECFEIQRPLEIEEVKI